MMSRQWTGRMRRRARFRHLRLETRTTGAARVEWHQLPNTRRWLAQPLPTQFFLASACPLSSRVCRARSACTVGNLKDRRTDPQAKFRSSHRFFELISMVSTGERRKLVCSMQSAAATAFQIWDKPILDTVVLITDSSTLLTFITSISNLISDVHYWALYRNEFALQDSAS